MNIAKEWQRRLEMVKEDINAYENYLNEHLIKLNINTKESLISQLQSKKKYRQLIEETLEKLGG